LEASQAAGVLRRQYVNRQTGATLTLMLLVGRPGPVAVHTPDVCYRNSGYAQIGPDVVAPVPGVDGAGFRVLRLKKDAAVPIDLRIWYSWAATGQWEAPDNPRVHFARSPVLYKLYVIRELPRADEAPGDDPAPEFLRAFLTQVGPVLFPTAPTEPAH
jgi:hypothetical protein